MEIEELEWINKTDKTDNLKNQNVIANNIEQDHQEWMLGTKKVEKKWRIFMEDENTKKHYILLVIWHYFVYNVIFSCRNEWIGFSLAFIECKNSSPSIACCEVFWVTLYVHDSFFFKSVYYLLDLINSNFSLYHRLQNTIYIYITWLDRKPNKTVSWFVYEQQHCTAPSTIRSVWKKNGRFENNTQYNNP